MKSFAICALVAAGVSAVPMAAPHHAHRHQKRDIVWVTETDVAVVTVPVIQTVWVSAGAATEQAYGGHGHRSSSTVSSAPASSTTTSSADVASTTSSTTSSVYVAPTTSSTTSVYVAPTTSSTTSVYVAPTTISTTTSPAYVAPTTTTSAYVAPTTTTASEYTPPAYTSTTSTYVAPTTTSSTAAATTTASSSGGGSGTQYVGALSYYEVGLGSCGITNTDSENVVAMDADMMDKTTMCGKMITITANGVTQQAQVVDTCPGCRGNAGLDLSPSLFASFAPTASGIVPSATWSFN